MPLNEYEIEFMFRKIRNIRNLGNVHIRGPHIVQPRTQGICSWGAKYPGMAWSRDPRILRKMAYCLLGSGE